MPESSPASPQPAVLSRPVHLYHLKSVGQALRQALAEGGWAADRISQRLQKDCSARCAECGFTVSGAELEQVFQSEPSHNPKIRRLQQGACARKECPSYFYDVQFRESGEVDWAKLWEKSGASREMVDQAPDEAGRTTWVNLLLHRPGRRELALAALLILVMVVFLCLRFRTPSWSSKPSPYRVDTNTIYQIAPESVAP